MITIRLSIGGKERYAQDRSKTFDGAFTVVRQSEAKRFDTVRDAHIWLARHGFMRKRRCSRTGLTIYHCLPIPAPFDAWELDGVTRETPVS